MSIDEFQKFPLRFLGYTYSLGDAIGYAFPIHYKYHLRTVAIDFVLVHIIAATIKAGETGWFAAFFYVLCFEALASIIIPTILTNQLCRLTADLMLDIHVIPRTIRRMAPVVVAFGAIPFYFDYLDPNIHIFLVFINDHVKGFFKSIFESSCFSR